MVPTARIGRGAVAGAAFLAAAMLPSQAGILDPNDVLVRTFIDVTPGADFENGNYEHRRDLFTNTSQATLVLNGISVVLLNPEDVGFPDIEASNLDEVVAAAAEQNPTFFHWGTSYWNFAGNIPPLDVPPVNWVSAQFPGATFPIVVGPGQTFLLETVAHNSFFGPVNPPPERIGELVIGWRFLTQACGNGLPEPGEECDDGNANDLDGCRNDCTIPRCGDGIVDAQLQEACDDGNQVDTDGCRNDCTLPICGDGSVDFGEECDDGNQVDTDGCRNDCTIPVCGDGIVDSQNKEACDDGNQIDTDGCRNDCTLPVCGDSIVDGQLGETCDPPGQPSGANDLDCRVDCTVCGDGVTDLQHQEECDDGNAIDTDACRNDCTQPVCGDGRVDFGEECDDGNQIDDDGCRNDCTIPVCGDGIVDSLNKEECDDGNQVDDDGCRNNCTIPVCGDGIVDAQLGETCDPPGQPSGANDLDCRIDCTVCGDAVVDPGEDCDDGNSVDTDACPNDCMLAVCGNGTVDPGEECDDGNQTNVDACRNDCTLPFCGDGIADPIILEECDDGNQVDDDGCRNDCTIPVCGDGIVDPQLMETCDPPGVAAGPSGNLCRGDCTLCGDGVLDVGEECDDGNGVDNDACRNDCTDHGIITRNTDGVAAVYRFDLEFDGDSDVISASPLDNKVAWFENVNGDGSAWTEHLISDQAMGARAVTTGTLGSSGYGYGAVPGVGGREAPAGPGPSVFDYVFSADSASNTISYYENVQGDGLSWIPRTVSTTVNGVNSVQVADLNGDACNDVVASSGNDGTVVWFADGQCDAASWSPAQTIGTGLTGASDTAVIFVTPNFTNLDVLAVGTGGGVRAYLNNGSGTAWNEIVLSNTETGANAVAFADIEFDGDFDVVVAATGTGVTWFENLGTGTAWTRHEVSATFTGASSVVGGDFDADEDDDILATSVDGRVGWFENTMGDGSVWVYHQLSTQSAGASSVDAAEFDGDFQTDCVVGAADIDTIAWFGLEPPSQPAGFCGNGVREPGEDCDDGNVLEADGCTNGCTASPTPEGRTRSKKSAKPGS